MGDVPQFEVFSNLGGPQDGTNFDAMWVDFVQQQDSGMPRPTYPYSQMNHTGYSNVPGYSYGQDPPHQPQYMYDVQDDSSRHGQLRVDTGAPPRVHVSSDPSSSINSAGSIPLTPYTSWEKENSHLQVYVPSGTPSSPSGAFPYPFSPRQDQKGLSPAPSPISPHSPAAGMSSSDEASSGFLPVDDDDDGDAPQPMTHIVQWKSIPERATITTGTGIYIPQTIYQPYTEADRVRYIEKADLKEPIIFVTSDQWGIPLEDALRARMKDLLGRDDYMFENCGPSVSIRLQWPGYRAWTKQIPTMDFKSPKRPITKSKLAKNIANCVKRFIEDKEKERMEIEADRKWKVGKRSIRMEDLMLVSLHHISKGSWQPQLRLRTPLNAIQERRVSHVPPPGV